MQLVINSVIVFAPDCSYSFLNLMSSYSLNRKLYRCVRLVTSNDVDLPFFRLLPTAGHVLLFFSFIIANNKIRLRSILYLFSLIGKSQAFCMTKRSLYDKDTPGYFLVKIKFCRKAELNHSKNIGIIPPFFKWER